MFDPPTFATPLADTLGSKQLDPTANITLRTLLTASRPRPLTVNSVDAPPAQATTVTGENALTPPTNNSPLPTLTNVVFDAAATKFTHTEYEFAANPTPAPGRLTTNAVLFVPLFTNELADTLGHAQLGPTANITLRTLFTASRPTPLTVINVDAPAAPANTLTGENALTPPTNNNPLPTLVKFVADTDPRKFTHTEYDPAASPTLTGRFTTSSVLFDPATFANELEFTLGDTHPVVPTPNITLFTLFTASRPSPLTGMMLDTPATPANTLSGENELTPPTSNNPLPALV